MSTRDRSSHPGGEYDGFRSLPYGESAGEGEFRFRIDDVRLLEEVPREGSPGG